MPLLRPLGVVLTALSLAGSAVLLSGSATAAAPPAGADLVGTVTVDGAPVAGLAVYLYDETTVGRGPMVGAAFTDEEGRWWVDFDASGSASASDFGDYDGSVDRRPVGGRVKVKAGDDIDRPHVGLRAHGEWFGGGSSLATAPAVTLATDGITVLPTIDLGLAAGVTGTVTGTVPVGYSCFVYVQVFETGGDPGGAHGVVLDHVPGGVSQRDFFIDDLDPDRSYKVSFTGELEPIGGVSGTPFAPTFYPASPTWDGAAVVLAGGPGSVTTGIDATVPCGGPGSPVDTGSTSTPSTPSTSAASLQASRRPALVGQVSPGTTLRVDPGQWTTSGATFTVQWLANGSLVGTGLTHRLTEADLGTTVSAVVTARVGDAVGSAVTESVRVGLRSRLRVTATPARRTGRASIDGTLGVQGVSAALASRLASGAIMVLEEGAVVGSGRVRRGELHVTLRDLSKGRHTCTVVFSGSRRVAAAQSVVTVKG